MPGKKENSNQHTDAENDSSFGTNFKGAPVAALISGPLQPKASAETPPPDKAGTR